MSQHSPQVNRKAMAHSCRVSEYSQAQREEPIWLAHKKVASLFCSACFDALKTLEPKSLYLPTCVCSKGIRPLQGQLQTQVPRPKSLRTSSFSC